MAEGKKIGEVIHFYNKINVAIIELTGTLEKGDKVRIGDELEQEAKSMEVDHEKIEKAKKGQQIGLKVKEQVREGDEVFKL